SAACRGRRPAHDRIGIWRLDAVARLCAVDGARGGDDRLASARGDEGHCLAPFVLSLSKHG
nr:hypothetical protein [Tanacetum cinerariifolium]